MMVLLVGIWVIEVGARRFISLNKFFGGFDAQRIPMPIEVTNDSPGLTGTCLYLIRNFKITGCRFGNDRSERPFQKRVSVLSA